MQVKREQIKPSIPTHTERGRRRGKKRKKTKCCHKRAGMEKQVSANDDLNPTRCCCVPSVKCMHQFEFDRWGKKRKESPKKKKSLFKTIYGIKGFHNRMWRFISTAKYYRNDSSCFPAQIIFKFSEAPCKVSMQTVDEQRREDIHRGRLLTCFKLRGLYYLFVLTRWHIYSSGVHAKIIWHSARDSQVCSGHDFDPVCYPSVDEGTLVLLNEKRNGTSRAYMSDFSADSNKIYFRECERCVLHR